jgi:CRP-like cAMP-binding protein
MEKSEIVKRSEFFHELNDKELDSIVQICNSEVFEQGTVICKQDQKADKIYLIEDGLVGIILEVGPLSQRQVQAASDYKVFGWSALIPPYTNTATVKALKNTKVLAWNAEDLRKLFNADHNMLYKVNAAVACVVAKRLREAYHQLLGVTSQD